MIGRREITRIMLGRAIPGDRFAHLGSVFEVLAVDKYSNDAGRRRVVVTLAGECVVCGERYEFTAGRSPTWLPRTCRRHRWMGPRMGGGDHGGA